MNTYMLFLYNRPDDFEHVGPEEMQAVIEKYKAWGESLEAAGRLVGSEKLTDEEGRVLSRRDGSLRITDGPFSETKEIVGGYFAIQAESYDDAVDVAKGCPHIEFGTIEIRAVDAMHPAKP